MVLYLIYVINIYLVFYHFCPIFAIKLFSTKTILSQGKEVLLKELYLPDHRKCFYFLVSNKMSFFKSVLP